MKTLDMKTLNKKTTLTDWVAALRSGKYKQQQGTLKGAEGYCCLGVFCSINGKEPEVSTDEGSIELYTFCKNSIDNSFLYCEAIQMNDQGKSFEEIANFIEKETNYGKPDHATV